MSLSDLPASYDRDMTTPPPGYFDDGYEILDEQDDEEDEEEQETALIEITRLPQIVDNLRLLKESWEQKAAEAASMVCTAESVQTVKKMRADMRREFDEANTQRKAVKERYMAAWNEVDKTWKECVAEPFREADNTYRVLVNEFEDSLKASCKEGLRQYFGELCAVMNVDFLTLEQAMNIGGIKISMADATAKTPKRLQDALSAIVSQISIGMDQIQSMEDAAEIMAEFKQTFDVGKAVANVQGRKRRIKAEQAAAEARRSAQERQQEAAKKVEAVAPPKEVEPPRAEKIFPEFSFTVYDCTRTQLIKIREYLKQEGIRYE